MSCIICCGLGLHPPRDNATDSLQPRHHPPHRLPYLPPSFPYPHPPHRQWQAVTFILPSLSFTIPGAARSWRFRILYSGPPGRFPLLHSVSNGYTISTRSGEASLSTSRKKKKTFVIEQLVFSHSRSANQVIRLRLQLAVSRSQMDEVAGAPLMENDCRGVDTL